ncbi:collagen triple helix repeat-containing protein 1-like [Watersipora subatra]|uniref:collagen triple helix repeat-containing protein 1-like n=1 Tax=Watersipora subatra TaxID=2589382 RepID=UPI00355B2D27
MAPDGKTLYRLPQMNVATFGAFHLTVGINRGVVWDLGSYRKLYTNSGLRLSLSCGARAKTDSEECCRFFFVINNADCSTPGPIEGVISMNVNSNIHRPILIEGICEGIPAGDVNLSVHVGYCKDQVSIADCHFGHKSYDHVMASEVYAEREIIYF